MAIVKITRLQRILTKSRLVSRCLRALSTSSQTYLNHYDVLEITPKATQGDIKSAYYKLSKIYHPDKSNNDEASAKKFRAISEAYEVLGNVNLKKMYDKGLLVGRENSSRMDYQPDPEPTDPTLKFYKSRGNRQVAPTMDGRTPIYDFDTWSKNHYGDLFKKSQYEKELLKKKKQKQADTIQSNHQEALIYMIFGLGALFALLVAQGKDNYDQDMIGRKKASQNADNRD